MNGLGIKIISFTNVYFSEYEKRTIDDQATLPDDYNDFLFHLLDKVVENFSCIGELMRLSEEKKMLHLKNSLYILLRSSLADIIIGCWLMHDSGKSNENVETEINEKVFDLKRDHIRFYVSFLNKMQSLGLLPIKDRDKEIEIINSNYSQYLVTEIDTNLNYNAKNIKRSTPISDMLNENNKNFKILVDAYTCYFIFSKVEHYGEFTKMIMEKTYEMENPMDQYIEKAIRAIEQFVKTIAPIIFNDDKDFSEKINAIKIIG